MNEYYIDLSIQNSSELLKNNCFGLKLINNNIENN